MARAKRRRFGPRDLPQSARVRGDSIEVTSRVGATITERWSLLVTDWQELERQHPNPAWWKRDLVRQNTLHLDEQPGGPEQADIVRDGQVSAIEAALKAMRGAA